MRSALWPAARRLHFTTSRFNSTLNDLRKVFEENAGGQFSPRPIFFPVGEVGPALAIKFQGMLRDSTVRDQTELARLARIAQPRMKQILNLTFLAPDIQEAILFLDGVAVSEKMLRPISVEPSWVVQRRMWRELETTA